MPDESSPPLVSPDDGGAKSASPSPDPSIGLSPESVPVASSAPTSTGTSQTNSVTNVPAAYVDPIRSSTFPPNFFYPDDHTELVRTQRYLELSPDFIQLHRSFGFDCSRRNALHIIDHGVLMFVMGNTVQTLDMHTGKQDVIYGHNQSASAGVSCIAVHPSHRYFAVAESGTRPHIYIYAWPSMKVVRILRGGADQSFGALCFSPCGSRLGSVGGDPDYALTVWEWTEERVLLRNKAFSQAVSTLVFSPKAEGVMYTAGQAHIKFWTLAQTFTGLKLQGAIGKFGKQEICDVRCVCESGGVIVAGTENGQLFVWDGTGCYIRAVLRRSWGRGELLGSVAVDENGTVYVNEGDEVPAGAAMVVRVRNLAVDGGVITSDCHVGDVEHVSVESGVLTSIGSDGYIRHWGWTEVSEAEGPRALECLSEIDTGLVVRSAVRVPVRGESDNGGGWVLSDVRGTVCSVDASGERRVMLSTHSGAAVVARSTRGDVMVTAGACGSVRVWDMVAGRQVCARMVAEGTGCTSILRTDMDGEERFVVGCDDGTVRVLALVANGISVLGACRPHNTRITGLLTSADGNMLVSAAADGTLFFTALAEAGARMQPMWLVQLPLLQHVGGARQGERLRTVDRWLNASQSAALSKGDGVASGVCGPVSLCWGCNSDGTVAMGYGKYLVEVAVPSGDASDDRDSYLISVGMRVREHSLGVVARRHRTEEEQEVFQAALAAAHANGETVEDAADDGFVEEVVSDPRDDPLGVVAVNPFYNDPVHPLFNNGQPSYVIGFASSGNTHGAQTIPGVNAVSAEEKYRALYVCGSDAKMFLGGWVYGVSQLVFGNNNAIMYIGGSNGTLEVRDGSDPHYYICHHADDAAVLGLCGDGRWVGVTTATGGVWVVKQDLEGALVEADRTHTMGLYAGMQMPALVEKERAKHLRGIEARGARGGRVLDIEITPRFIDGAWCSDGAADIGSVRLLYSAEEAKQRQEKDELAALATKKAALLKREMADLRAEFEKLQAKALAVGVRIDGASIDAESHAALRVESEKAAAELEAGMRDEVEREVRACERLVNALLRNVEHESLTVAALCTGDTVKAHRTMKLQYTPCTSKQHNTYALCLGQDPVAPAAAQDSAVDESEFPGLDSATATVASGGTDVERRREVREQRRTLMRRVHDAMQVSVPEPDKADLEMGTYKLKLDGGVQVHIDADGDIDAVMGSTCTCVDMRVREAVWAITREMWERVCALRQVKYTLLGDLCRKAMRVVEINQIIGVDEDADTALMHIGFAGEVVRSAEAESKRVQALQWFRQLSTGTHGREERVRVREGEGVQGIVNALAHCCSEEDVHMVLSACADAREWPEAKYIVTDDELSAYAVWLAEEAGKSKRTPVGGFGGEHDDGPMSMSASASNGSATNGSGSGIGSGANPLGLAASMSGDGASERDNVSETALAVEHIMRVWEQRDLHSERLALVAANYMEEHECVLEVLALREEKEALLASMEYDVRCFDHAVETLRVEKVKADRDVAALCCKLLSTAEERMVSEAYRELESSLRTRMQRCVQGVAAVAQEVKACEEQIENYNRLVGEGEGKREGLLREFNALVQGYIDNYKAPEDGESEVTYSTAELYPMLLRLFLHNGNGNGSPGAGKAEGPGEGSFAGTKAEDGERDDDEAKDEDEEDEDEDDDELNFAILHDTCDPTLLEAVQELRTVRLEVEAEMTNHQQQAAELHKNLQRLSVRAKNAEKEAFTIAEEAAELGADKREALNKLYTGVPLRLSQMHVCKRLEGAGREMEWVSKTDLSDSIIIGTDTLQVLQSRVDALDGYCRMLQEQIRALKREGRQLSKEVELKRKKLTEEEEHCREVQLLKFGQVIELDVLSKVGADDGTQEMKNKLRWMEELSERKAREWEAKVRIARDELYKATEENTILLDKVSKLSGLQHEVERELNNQTKSLHVKQHDGRKIGINDGDDAERQKEKELVAKIQAQERDLDALRAEIHALKTKKGRVYAPN